MAEIESRERDRDEDGDGRHRDQYSRHATHPARKQERQEAVDDDTGCHVIAGKRAQAGCHRARKRTLDCDLDRQDQKLGKHDGSQPVRDSAPAAFQHHPHDYQHRQRSERRHAA